MNIQLIFNIQKKRNFMNKSIKNKIKRKTKKVISFCLWWLPDYAYVKIMYFIRMGRICNLKNPQTFNEKIQYLKLYDRNPSYTNMVDKYEAKKIVAKIIGDDYIIPTLFVYDSFDEIDFDKLPEKFVLKTTHDSGGVIICKAKDTFDIKKARKLLNDHLRNNYYKSSREWPYKNIKPRIIAEKYIEDIEGNDLKDYKIFCFEGKPKFLFVATDRQKINDETKFDFFDIDFNHIDVTNGHPNAEIMPKRPRNYESMLEIAKKISKGIPHVRVDLYSVGEKIYFGELTFSHWSGFVKFNPNYYDKLFGGYIDLNKIKK